MALSIKNQEAERLAHEVAELSGSSITAGVVAALSAYRQRLLSQSESARRLRSTREYLEREIWSLPDVNTDRTDGEILGYGPSGAPE